MTSTTTKPAAKQLEAETTVYLFDDWFDPIEASLRDRVRDFIETMIRTELDTALARPRYARRPVAGQVGDGIAGHRHGRRTRTLMRGRRKCRPRYFALGPCAQHGARPNPIDVPRCVVPCGTRDLAEASMQRQVAIAA